ncbi:MAG: DNA-3-methyladenine glycosylase 2 family protein [Haloarculaceae archaeon]
MSEEAVTHLRSDPDLAPLVEEHGPLELEPADDPFRRLVVSLTRQQVSMAAAAAIEKRLFDAVDVSPEGLLAAEESTLRDAGLSRQKTEYVRAVARAWREREYDRGFFEGMDDEAVTAELTGIHGVGTWTAKMFLLFALGRPDIFPVEDLGIRRGMESLYGDGMDRQEMVAAAERWRPYRSTASLYLWRAVD